MKMSSRRCDSCLEFKSSPGSNFSRHPAPSHSAPPTAFPKVQGPEPGAGQWRPEINSHIDEAVRGLGIPLTLPLGREEGAGDLAAYRPDQAPLTSARPQRRALAPRGNRLGIFCTPNPAAPKSNRNTWRDTAHLRSLGRPSRAEIRGGIECALPATPLSAKRKRPRKSRSESCWSPIGSRYNLPYWVFKWTALEPRRQHFYRDAR